MRKQNGKNTRAEAIKRINVKKEGVGGDTRRRKTKHHRAAQRPDGNRTETVKRRENGNIFGIDKRSSAYQPSPTTTAPCGYYI
jgi:hypothetical protein